MTAGGEIVVARVGVLVVRGGVEASSGGGGTALKLAMMVNGF